MKFFIKELFDSCDILDNEERNMLLDRAFKMKYEYFMNNVFHLLAECFRDTYLEENCFHDYVIKSLKMVRGRSGHINVSMVIQLGSKGYVIDYLNVAKLNLSVSNDFIRNKGCIGIINLDEFTLSNDGHIIHEILLFFGGTLKIEFDSINIESKKEHQKM